MTEQTDAAEALAESLGHIRGASDDTCQRCREIDTAASILLTSDWLTAREAAAETRGARYALLDAADRAAVRGVEGDASNKALTETRSEYREALDRLGDR